MLKNFYENYHIKIKSKRSKVEKMKQNARLKVIREFLHNYKLQNKKILIVGCGFGEDTLVAKNRVIAFDLAFSAVKMAKHDFPKNIYLVADAAFLPFIDNSFDCIVCSEVIEHIPNPQEVIIEFRRVLRPQGELIITVPNWISYYGLARKIGEFIFKKPITTMNQPIDNWYTFGALQKQLKSNFWIIERRGIWYYPPTGKGYYVIPDFIIMPIFRFFQPLDWFLGKVFPTIGGHIIVIRCIKKDREVFLKPVANRKELIFCFLT